MELRWYQTYDKNGVDSDIFLQYREDDSEEWENVTFIRERKIDEEE